MTGRFLIGVQRALSGVLVRFGLLIASVLWACNDPEALRAVAGKLADAAVALVSWLADLVVPTLDRAGD